MALFERLVRRITFVDDSETRQSQKRLSIIVMVAATIFTLLGGFQVRSAGLIDASYIYFALAVIIVVAFIVLLMFPRAYQLIVVVLLCTSFFTNLPAHLLAGGYTSGLVQLIWILLPPVVAVLFVERRWVLFLVFAFAMTVIAAAIFEPLARSRMPDIDMNFVIQYATFNMIFLGIILVGASTYLFSQIERYRQQADRLLLNILPKPIARRLKDSPGAIADGYDDVTILFADIVGFTNMSSGVDPADVVNLLNALFSEFDALTAKHGLEKIKTIGDAYMVAGGLPVRRADHCEAVAAFALDIITATGRHTSWTGEPVAVRIGMNRGAVVAGVIGQQKFIYDLWGDAVNVASRMESSGLANDIQVTQAVKDRLEGRYRFDERGQIEVKGKGQMTTYWLRPLA
ncbi:MAG: hypothetical protein J5I90_14045 [Caldilineales bacterium]|nr:hypothetical protein [Caldilineales bacterium]